MFNAVASISNGGRGQAANITLKYQYLLPDGVFGRYGKILYVKCILDMVQILKIVGYSPTLYLEYHSWVYIHVNSPLVWILANTHR